METISKEEKQRLIEERREKKLAKLSQRNEERKTTTIESETKIEEKEVDELMREVKEELQEKKTDSEKIDRLQKYLTFSFANHRTKAIQSLLEDIRKFKLAQKPTQKFKGFSFTKPKAQPTQKIEKPEKLEDVMAVVGVSAENVVENIENETKVISGKNATDVSLKNIQNCRLEFDFEPSVVHIRNIKNSTIIFMRCHQSILMHDCENIHLHVAAQQIRVHTSKNVHLHVATRGAVILEETTQVYMHPYKVYRKNGQLVNVEDNGEWRTPRDFDWLATSQSPNWTLVTKEQEEEEAENLSF